ncbi:S8 family peptidase [Chitinimonas sp. BJB300]|uniref:S8 family peptidase n=1 Tax=Chitinimonas sp. BJB300 TaxID=1559339 RepID=UPI000C10F83F|nr:S8 family peptidase [Chitinimonas sp. BJB300]PHV13070.1 peptidase S8 [Chitinimonas sp. BJB300]TSJ87720.1 S8 family serine peptidase [Chitinimonas sp. BJB300]
MKYCNQWAPLFLRSRLAIALGMALSTAFAAQDVAVNGKPINTDRIIVKYRADAISSSVLASPNSATAVATLQSERQGRMQAAGSQLGVSVKFVRGTGLGAQVWKLDRARPLTEVAAMASRIAKSDPTVEYAEPDRLLHHMAAAPNDSHWFEQWDLQNTSVGINVLGAWDHSTGTGVNVAVIDTGYRPHADLAANVVGGYDMVNDVVMSNDGDGRDADASDPGDATNEGECGVGEPATHSSWHGTHVAGTIAAIANNGIGVAGIAPGAKIVPMRVLGRCGGYTADIADAMIWASGGEVTGLPHNTHPARVLNLSLGGGGACDVTSQNAIDAARANGAVVVVAAGNETRDVSRSSPANCSGVIAVAAYGKTGTRAYYSNFGNLVDISGPGGDQSTGDSDGTLSILNNGLSAPGADSYAYYQGTSMAAPHVSAVAALMISAKPSLTPDEVESLLKSSAKPFVASCRGCGAGMLDAYAAVQAAIGGTRPPAGSNEVEPNNSMETANEVLAPATMSGTIALALDKDYFKVTVPARHTLVGKLTSPKKADYDLYLYDAEGNQVAKSILGEGRVDVASVKNYTSTSAVYYARVVYESGLTGSTNGMYTLNLSW